MASSLPRIDPLTFVLIMGILVAATVAFWPLFDVIILSLSLAVVVLPLHRSLCNMMKEGLAAGFTTLFVMFFFLSTFLFTINVIYQNGEYLAEIVSIIIEWVRSFRLEFLDAQLLIPPAEIAELLKSQVAVFSEYLSGLFRAIPLLIVKLIIFFLSLYMFIYRGDAIKEELMNHLPGKINEATDRMSEMSVNTLYAIYVVHFATSILTFILAVPFFYFLGYGHVLFYAVLAAIFQLIPILGPSFLMVFLAFFALTTGDTKSAALIAFIGYPVVCAFPDIYLRPLMMGKRASINPVLMWIGFFGGLAVMGIVGFVLGPLFIALMVSGYRILIDELKETKQEIMHE
jgi:predicted PurR-regulated permease PerM